MKPAAGAERIAGPERGEGNAFRAAFIAAIQGDIKGGSSLWALVERSELM